MGRCMVIDTFFPMGKMCKPSKCSLVDKQVNIMYILYIYIYISHIHMHTMECFEALK